jgi:hypothetical protein
MTMDWTEAAGTLTSSGWLVSQDGVLHVAVAPPECRHGKISEPCARALKTLIFRCGAVLVRRLTELDAARFGALVRVVSGEELLPYTERSSPRTEILPGVYTSTEHSPREEIFFHNENSYQSTWPGLIAFWCRRPSAEGGATPIVDVRSLPKRLSRRTLETLSHRGYRITRNYDPHFGLGWSEVFGTQDRAEVERCCAAHQLDVTWTPGGRLRTETIRPALAEHPLTGDPVWFNHLAFFNAATLRPRLREALLATTAPEELPSNTSYGDGAPFEQDLLEEIKAAYAEGAVDFAWSAGDVLILDNMAFGHGRRVHGGNREVLVAMSRPLGWLDTRRPVRPWSPGR